MESGEEMGRGSTFLVAVVVSFTPPTTQDTREDRSKEDSCANGSVRQAGRAAPLGTAIIALGLHTNSAWQLFAQSCPGIICNSCSGSELVSRLQ